MYICLCNNINSKKVNYAIEKGVSSSKKIYSFYNCKPKCGKCIDLMNCIVEKEGDKITNQRMARRNADGYYSPDGKAIRKALLKKDPESAAKVLVAHELAGCTYVFNEKECYLIEGGFLVRKEDATKDNPRKFIHKLVNFYLK